MAAADRVLNPGSQQNPETAGFHNYKAASVEIVKPGERVYQDRMQIFTAAAGIYTRHLQQLGCRHLLQLRQESVILALKIAV